MQNSPAKVHIVVGTKAQLIKMFPVIRELQRRNLSYNFIDTGQHPLITKSIAISLRRFQFQWCIPKTTEVHDEPDETRKGNARG